MAVYELARFTVVPEQVDSMLKAHTAAVTAMSRAFPGLQSASLARIDDTTWLDVWEWDSMDHAKAAASGAPSVPEAAELFAHIESVASMEHAAIVAQYKP